MKVDGPAETVTASERASAREKAERNRKVRAPERAARRAGFACLASDRHGARLSHMASTTDPACRGGQGVGRGLAPTPRGPSMVSMSGPNVRIAAAVSTVARSPIPRWIDTGSPHGSALRGLYDGSRRHDRGLPSGASVAGTRKRKEVSASTSRRGPEREWNRDRAPSAQAAPADRRIRRLTRVGPALEQETGPPRRVDALSLLGVSAVGAAVREGFGRLDPRLGRTAGLNGNRSPREYRAGRRRQRRLRATDSAAEQGPVVERWWRATARRLLFGGTTRRSFRGCNDGRAWNAVNVRPTVETRAARGDADRLSSRGKLRRVCASRGMERRQGRTPSCWQVRLSRCFREQARLLAGWAWVSTVERS